MNDARVILIKSLTDEIVPNFSEFPVFLIVGTFDGVHLGHKKLIDTSIELAKTNNGIALAYTFLPHPSFITRPNNPKMMIYSRAKKIQLLKTHELMAIIEQHFSEEFSKLSPDEFIKFLKMRFPSLKCICVGENFQFGHNKSGNVKVLKDLAKKNELDIMIMPALQINGQKVSSSLIRELMKFGNHELAKLMLGNTEFL